MNTQKHELAILQLAIEKDICLYGILQDIGQGREIQGRLEKAYAIQEMIEQLREEMTRAMRDS